MKNTHFLELMNEIDDDLIERARNPKKKKYTRKLWISSIAACLALCIILGAVIRGLGGLGYGVDGTSGSTGGTGGTGASHIYAGIADKNGFNICEAAYRDDGVDMAPFYEYYAEHGGIEAFYKASLAEMLKTEKGENTVYSPANVYMALAMLAEMTGGESRRQILALLGEENIEAVRENANALWNISHKPGEEGTTLIANSVWANEKYDEFFNPELFKTLGTLYHTSSYSGNFNDEAYVNSIKDWVHGQTKGLLEDMEMDWQLTEETVLALASTIYFADAWKFAFNEADTKEMTFCVSNKEAVKCEYLCEYYVAVTEYVGKKFIAIEKKFENGGSMIFVLPNREYTVEDLLRDKEYLAFISNPHAWENTKETVYDVLVPKFDILEENDIIGALKNLGVTDIFEEGKADFTPLTDIDNLFVGEIDHGARITIDENGCVAAGYTLGSVFLGGSKIAKFDRPFAFTVITENNVPLFAGVINNPTKS